MADDVTPIRPGQETPAAGPVAEEPYAAPLREFTGYLGMAVQALAMGAVLFWLERQRRKRAKE